MDHSGEENKKELIIEYVFEKGKEHGLKDELIKEIILKVIESPKTIEEIKEDINKLIAKYKEKANKEGEDLSEEMRPKESTSIYSTSPSGSMVITPQDTKAKKVEQPVQPQPAKVEQPKPIEQPKPPIQPIQQKPVQPHPVQQPVQPQLVQPVKPQSVEAKPAVIPTISNAPVANTAPVNNVKPVTAPVAKQPVPTNPAPQNKPNSVGPSLVNVIASPSPSGSMVITPKPKDDSINELQEMMESDESKEKESTPMHKESPSRVMVKTNNNANKGYASTMSIASSLGIIIGIIFLLLLLLLLI